MYIPVVEKILGLNTRREGGKEGGRGREGGRGKEREIIDESHNGIQVQTQPITPCSLGYPNTYITWQHRRNGSVYYHPTLGN